MWGFLFIAAAVWPQQLSYDVRVINIEVPVRVFQGDQFVDHLTLDDFEVLEDGVEQKIEAIYLINKTNLERKEENTIFKPETSRSFYLFFSLYEPNPQLPKALTYFFQKVITPEDHLLVISPRAVYDLKKEMAAKIPAEKIAAGLAKKLRKDILVGDSAYGTVLADLKRMVGAGGIEQMNKTLATYEMKEEQRAQILGSGTLEELIMKYRSDVDQLEQLRTIDEGKFLDFARALKKTEGQKIVFYFYQKEFVPLLDLKTLGHYADNSNVQALVADLSGMLNRKSSLNMDRLKKTFADSSINVHFLYLTSNPADIPLSQIGERQDIFSTFDEIAKATGGLTARSANADYLMQQASQAAEKYYILYYSPKNKTPDGKFRTVTVRVKSGNYRVAHMAGYFAK
jgi:VWFA-related protein